MNLKLTQSKIEAQEAYCKKNKCPNLAPEFCPKCNTNVFEGYSLDECSDILITYCKKCNRSFVD